jgi:hypothetical protein
MIISEPLLTFSIIPMSGFLVPQEPISNVLAALSQHPIYVSQLSRITQLCSTPIPPSLFETLMATLQRTPRGYSSSVFGAQWFAQMYNWTQEGNKITITGPWNSKWPDTELTVTADDVTSPIISGSFFDTVLSSAVSFAEDRTSFSIELEVTREWPLIIRPSDRIDHVSLFYLAVFAGREGLESAVETLLLPLGVADFVPAVSVLAHLCLDSEREAEAFFWFVRYANLTGEIQVLVVPAQILIANDLKNDAILAENIVVALARAGHKKAFYMLGCLHLRVVNGFQTDTKLAVRYFEHGTQKYADNECRQALAVLLIKGQGIPKDVRRGIQLLREAGEPEEKLQRLMRSLEPEPEESEEGEPSMADWLALGGIAVGVCTAAYLFFRFYRGRSKI